MTEPKPSDTAQALAYQRIADRMRADARSYMHIAGGVEARPDLLTFAKAYADGLRRKYEELADFCHEAAYQAQQVADDYKAHADGTYVPLATSDREAARGTNDAFRDLNQSWPGGVLASPINTGTSATTQLKTVTFDDCPCSRTFTCDEHRGTA